MNLGGLHNSLKTGVPSSSSTAYLTNISTRAAFVISGTGNDSRTFGGDGGLVLDAGMQPRDVSVAPDGSIWGDEDLLI